MHSQDIHPWDWYRILVGEVPLMFLVEIILRMAVVYFLLMSTMRLLGKRMAAQLSRNELAAMVALASAIGVPILSPDRGLLPAVIIALIVLCVGRLNIYLTGRYPKIESMFLGSISQLVKDSVMDLKCMTKTRISRDRLFAELRANHFKTLGEIKDVYIEANGRFTTVKADEINPGLCILPETDQDFIMELSKSEVLVCHVCGAQNDGTDHKNICSHCKNHQWENALA